MKTVKYPKTLEIGPFEFELQRHTYKEQAEELWGWFNASDQKISVADDIHPDAARETLLHEILHSSFWLADLTRDPYFKKKEEELITKLSVPLMTIFKHNPKLKDIFFD